MAKFDDKTWNDKVFQKYLEKVPNTKMNMFVKSGILKKDQALASRLVDGVGGNYIVEPIKGNLDGAVVNYDGTTDITATSRDTFEQGKIVVGRAKAWTEKDFSTDITGEEFLPIASLAGEVAEYFEGVDQDDILAILEGIFKMADTQGAKFVTKHTYDVTAKDTGIVAGGTLNRAITKASGDRKENFKLVIMHSSVAADLETLKLLDYMKYTDANGIERDLGIATWNGRIVFIDDECPVVEVPESKSGANDGYTSYVTYVLGKEFFEYADCGAKVPNEMARDPKTNGGETTLYVRQRHLYAPKYISFTKKSMAKLSPTKEELATGSNWEIVNNGKTGSDKKYINDKLIPVARIISKVSE